MIELASKKLDEHCFSNEGVGSCKQVATKFVHLNHARGTANTSRLDGIGAIILILIFVHIFLDAATLTEVYPCFFLGCKANARV